MCAIHYVLQILSLLEMLVRYGYYCRPTDIKNLVPPLIAMLDGGTDVPYKRENIHCVVAITYILYCD